MANSHTGAFLVEVCAFPGCYFVHRWGDRRSLAAVPHYHGFSPDCEPSLESMGGAHVIIHPTLCAMHLRSGQDFELAQRATPPQHIIPGRLNASIPAVGRDAQIVLYYLHTVCSAALVEFIGRRGLVHRDVTIRKAMRAECSDPDRLIAFVLKVGDV